MSRAALMLILALVPLTALARSDTDRRERSHGGAMSVEELGREPITFHLDIPYAGTRNPRQRLDLYLPKARQSETLAVIVFIHGGGWAQGNKSDGAGRLMPFVRTGRYAGVSIGYRVSGEAKWPAQIHDCKAAIRWVRANAGKHGFDRERVAVWGASAGGHLALMLGVSEDVPELEGNIGPHTRMSSKVSAVANYFGVTELLAIIGQPSDIDRTKPEAPEAKLLGGRLHDKPERAKAASPVTYVTPNDPPVLTVHGTEDRSVPYDQAVRLDAALRKAGVPSYFVTVSGADHGDFPTAVDDRLAAFFARYLLGQDVKISTQTIDDRRR